MELAFLNNKIREPDGKLVPGGAPTASRMSIAAAYPRWPWSDLVDALLPNGRFLDTQVAPLKQSLNPVGVPIQSYVAGPLSRSATSTGLLLRRRAASTPCTNARREHHAELRLPPGRTAPVAAAKAALNSTYHFHDGYAIGFVPSHSTPAPLLIQNGWTDDLFPPEQALRVYNYLRSRVRQGLPGRASSSATSATAAAPNKAATNLYFSNQGCGFFAAHLKGGPARPGSGIGDRVHPDLSEDDAGRRAVHRRELARDPERASSRSAGRPPRRSPPPVASSSVAQAFDPIAGTSDSCKTITRTNESNVATYQRDGDEELHDARAAEDHRQRRRDGAVRPDRRPALGHLADGQQQRLITRGVYSLRTNQTGKITFQLHGNGYRFAPGHIVQLELLGKDSPYYQAGNFPVSINVSKLTVSLPTKG